MRLRALVLLGVAFALLGCSAGVGVTPSVPPGEHIVPPSAYPGNQPPTTPATSAVHVPATCPTPTKTADGYAPLAGGPGGPIPAGFHTAWVLRCSVGDAEVAGKGEWVTLTTERADSPATALLDALRTPAPTTPGHVYCTQELELVPYLVLVDANGSAIRPAIPLDGCGDPAPAVYTALAALPFRTLETTPLTPVPVPPTR